MFTSAQKKLYRANLIYLKLPKLFCRGNIVLSILGNKEKITKQVKKNIVCSYDLAKLVLPNCVLLLSFKVYLASISHVYVTNK